ncbi:MAG: hypothetical protein HY884_05410 [Deltaproteobacteria bacterium]|nr:hypothetical protein [Deltaproteobacteria bacterium]
MGRNTARRVGTIVYKQNEAVSFELPRNFPIRGILLRMAADITIITAAATAYAQGAVKLIKRIEIIANGRDTLKSIDGPGLAELNRQMNGTVNPLGAVPTAVGANQLMAALLKIDFEMPRSVSPSDANLNSYLFSTLELKITFGAPSDMYSANSANVTINSAPITVTLLESEGNAGSIVHKVGSTEKEVTATSTDFQIALPVGNKFRGFLIRAEVDGNPNDSVINKIELRSGTTVFHKWDFTSLKDCNKIDYELESSPTGYVFIDFCPDGFMGEALATAGFSDLTLSFDVTKQTGINKITVYPVELI